MMTQFSTMTRPQLMQYLTTEKGHKIGYVSRLPTNALVDLATSGKAYDGGTGETTITVESKPTAKPMAPVTVPDGGDSTTSMLLKAIAKDLTPLMMTALRDELRTEFERAIENKPKELELTINLDNVSAVIKCGLSHVKIPRIVQIVIAKVPIYLFGPAGSGKTTAARQIAGILSDTLKKQIRFHFLSFGPASQAHEVKGYVDAYSKLVRTPFLDGWENGGVILLDEFDAAPDVMVVLNAALANGHFVFPDGRQVAKHEDCYLIAAGNTIGKGATNDYNARQRQDGATMDRFWFEPFDIDEKLETAMTGDHKWTRRVQSIRKAIKGLGVNAPDLMVSPRASEFGCKILAANPDMTFAELEEGLIWKGATEDDRRKVINVVGRS